MSDNLSARLLVAKNNLLEGNYDKAYTAYEALLLQGHNDVQVYLGMACSRLIAMLMDPIGHQHTYTGVVAGIFNYYREALTVAGSDKHIRPDQVIETIYGQLAGFLHAGDEQAMERQAHAAAHLQNAQAQQIWAIANRWSADEQHSKFAEYLAKRNMEQSDEHQRAHSLHATQAELLTRIRAIVKNEAHSLLDTTKGQLSEEIRHHLAESLLSPRERKERAALEEAALANARFKEECRLLDAALDKNQTYLANRQKALELHASKRYGGAYRAGKLAQQEFHRVRTGLFGNGPQRHFDNKLDNATAEAKKHYTEKFIWAAFLGGAALLCLWLFQ